MSEKCEMYDYNLEMYKLKLTIIFNPSLDERL